MSDNRNSFEIGPHSNANLSTPNSFVEVHNQYVNPSRNNARMALLREWRRIIFRHKWMILAIIIFVLPLSIIQAYRAKPIYQATSTIDIRPETSSLGEVVLLGSNDNIRAEMVIIKSLPVIRQAVLTLNLDRNPRFLDVSTKRSVLEALTSLGGGQPEQEKRRGALEKEKNVGGGEMKAAGDGAGKGPLSDAQAERKRIEPYIQTVLNNLSVEGVRDTRLVKISFVHTDPEIAANVANGIAESFNSYNYQTKTDRFTNKSKWLLESTRKFKAQVEMAEQKLADYTSENNIFSPEGKESLTANKLVQLHDKVMRAEFDRIIKQSLFEEVNLGRVAQLPEAFADPRTAELRKALSELAVEKAQLDVKFGAKHPRLIEIKQKMSALSEEIGGNQSRLQERLKADYERAIREETSLKSALEIAKSEAVYQNQATIQFSVLKQDLDTSKELYTDFLKQTNQTDIARIDQFNNVRAIEPAEPPTGPIGPNRNQTIMLGFVISLLLGVGLAYMIENLNTTIRTVDDITRVTQLPLLAVIPTMTENVSQDKRKRRSINGIRELTPAAMKNLDDSFEHFQDSSDKPFLADSMKMFSAAAEAYRMLRTSILLSTAGHPPKSMLVTSGQPGDGKTTTVFNIALALTQLKAEVVIVDCDMRRPRVHKLLQLNKNEGLSTYLTSGGDLDKFIVRGPVPHLSILPCGFVPPNPSELISSDAMKELLRSLEERFDYVILDSPPLASVTDPIILSTLVDGVILIVKSGQSKAELVSRVCQYLSSVGAKVLGVTLNNLDIRKDGYNYYQYYRNYASYIDHDMRKRSGE
jgi:polysaccharide biosynthesis transport protein